MDKSIAKELFKRCEQVADVFSSLAHPTRLKILCSLTMGEKTVSELTQICDITQPAMSQFLTRMKEDSLIKSRREGQKVFYTILDKNLLKLLVAIKQIYCD